MNQQTIQQRSSLLLGVVFLLFPILLSAQGDRIIPRHTFAKELTEYGRIECENCRLGEEIYPLPDLNGDGIREWATRTSPRDSSGNLLRNAWELRIYYGVRGGLPDVEEYRRVGPREILSSTDFMAAGDWDGDGHPDLATLLHVYGDSANGIPDGTQRKPMVIWWGNATGSYTLTDTAHLQIGMEGWTLPELSYSSDWNEDGIEDLMIINVGGYQNGEIVQGAPIQVWFGSQGNRWGRDRSRLSDWSWWNTPRATRFSIFIPNRIQWIDQDVDGHLDMVEYVDGGGGGVNGIIRIRYGRAGEVLDTLNVEEVDLTPANGKYALFADVTGDAVVPELLVNTGSEERLKVYVGFKGQRITEQFGSGNEPGHPGEEVWWGKPWAAFPLPGLLHDGWAAAGGSDIYDNGDGGLDGIGDIWVITTPDMVFYNGGNRLDSLYDGWIRGGGYAIGDIDGSGVPTIVTSRCSPPIDCVEFIKPSKEVPETGIYRRLPPGTEKGTVSVEGGELRVESGELLGLHVYPNPSSGEVVITWKSGESGVSIQITDVLGQEVLSAEVRTDQDQYVWDASKTFGGWYFVSVTVDGVTETMQIEIKK